jgi:hypothetical protein
MSSDALEYAMPPKTTWTTSQKRREVVALHCM